MDLGTLMRPARWTTESKSWLPRASETKLASVKSPLTSELLMSVLRTSKPLFDRKEPRLTPTKPLAPVRRILTDSDTNGFSP